MIALNFIKPLFVSHYGFSKSRSIFNSLAVLTVARQVWPTYMEDLLNMAKTADYKNQLPTAQYWSMMLQEAARHKVEAERIDSVMMMFTEALIIESGASAEQFSYLITDDDEIRIPLLEFAESCLKLHQQEVKQ